MKGSVRILGALGIGVVVVTAALLLRQGNVSGENGNLSVVATPDNSALRVADADGNGVEDWREELEKNVLEEITVSTSTFGLDQPYEEPKTFTDKFAQSFFQSFMEGKMMGKAPEDQTALIQEAVATVEAATKQRLYGTNDIVSTPATVTAIKSYANRVAEIVTENSAITQSEDEILSQALETNDPTKIEALEVIRAEYEEQIQTLLDLPTPQDFVSVHLTLINALEAMRMDVEAMESAFTDPLYTLARIKRYEDDVRGVHAALDGINTKLNESEAIFTKDEPAIFFLIFDND